MQEFKAGEPVEIKLENKWLMAKYSRSYEHGHLVYYEERNIYQHDDEIRPCDKQQSAGHPEYLRLLDEMRELHVRKSADYGRGQDSLANVRASAEFGIPAWLGVVVRASDKMHRIKSYVANGSLKNESIEDSLKDLAAYALIALVLLREEQKMKEEKPDEKA